MLTGRFDGPHFREDADIVSVWVATCPFDAIPENYFDEPSDDDDDGPWDKFSTDFGFGYYDLDFFEPNHADGKVVSVREIVEPCSYAKSFVDAVSKRAGELNVPNTSFVILMYNFRYRSELTGVNTSPQFRFVGVFDYDGK